MKTENLLLSKMKKVFDKHDIEIVKLNEEEETISVDGKKIELWWMPHSSKLKKDLLDVLIEDCKTEIKKTLAGDK